MDYAYTKYSGYNFATTSYDERYLNKSGMVTVGLGWRFGGPQPSTEAIDPTFMRGAYAGGQIAHGAVNSQLNAPVHYHASGNDSLLADFGKLETSSSAYLGYGHVFNRWYLGVEAELDPSLTRWSHDRTTSSSGGRDFAVSKKGNHGLDVRAGYVLDNGSLLYVRVGVSRAKFNTTYARGSNAVDRVDTLTGTRLGFGVEMPINKASFIRLDYLMSDYGSIPSFAAGGTGTSDLINISTKEGQFRVGFGVRF
jgi:opacity protein-like surface antigen